MGSRFKFKCHQCGLASVVSGGRDAGYSTQTKTVYCRACGTLQDILTWVNEGDLALMSSVARRKFKIAKACGRCGSADIASWREGDACPRCGGALRRDGQLVEMWD